MMALLRGTGVIGCYLLAAWASWHLVGDALWNGDDVSQIATPAAMIATAFLVGRLVEFAAGVALSRWRRRL
jgi:hypothetical protein